MDYKIEKGIPIPPLPRNKRIEKYDKVIQKLGKGDSLLIAFADMREKSIIRQRLYAAALYFSVKITIRTIDSNHIRVWRK